MVIGDTNVHWNKEDLAVLVKEYGKCKLVFLANKLGRTEKSLRDKASKLGLVANRSIARATLAVDRNFFSQFTNQSCYWAGFIAADGYISIDNKLILHIHRKDEDLLVKFKQELHYEGNIVQKEYKGRISSKLQIACKDISHDLKYNFGIMNNKSLVLKPPLILQDKEHILSYIIGYLDGDGWICMKNQKLDMGLCGTYDMMSWIAYYINKYYGVYLNIKKNNTIFCVRTSGTKAIYLRDELLKIQTPHRLSRKWNVNGL